ncbi:uncharacterized protein LOC128957372 isoform X2 [Oppia nitens]|uniref:uncharacterized protein LOC128957372 isoform X2 n=1 Tax=Oppia nitens TaxID=1686743 RepID=UPI0023DCDF1B|nr:uncharacterized protein LOC128957372 isoform X2 [Oppia nitens]
MSGQSDNYLEINDSKRNDRLFESVFKRILSDDKWLRTETQQEIEDSKDPAFCLKTRDLTTGEKIFINFCHSSMETMINWCITMGLLLATKKCPICDNEMKIIVKQLSYRCHQKHGQPHDYRLSALNNTWFSGSKFSIENIIILTYLFSVDTTKYEDIKRETSDLTKTTSHNTISDWLNFCREVVFDWVEKYQSVDLLGGEGVVVEIDETKVGKRKYNRGRLVDGTWILGLVEIQIGANCRRGGRFRLEICPLNKRDADTLLPLIRKHVKIGTTIVSDCWAGYYRLTDNGINDR